MDGCRKLSRITDLSMHCRLKEVYGDIEILDFLFILTPLYGVLRV